MSKPSVNAQNSSRQFGGLRFSSTSLRISLLLALAACAASLPLYLAPRPSAANTAADGPKKIAAVCSGTQRTWDGGGATNNWSEAANWCDNTLPNSGNTVVFDGTSNKNCTIDAAGPQGSNITVLGIQINTGYTNTGPGTGIITQVAGVSVTAASQCSQFAGTFVGSTGNITINGNFIFNGGIFTGGSGDIDINGQLNLSGGTFTASSNTTFVNKLTRSGTGAFQHQGGTVVLDGSVGVDHSLNGVVFNNLTCNKTGGQTSFLNGTPTVVGALTLQDGLVSNGTIAAQGNVSILGTFDGGSAALSFSGTADQTFTNSGGANLTGAWTVDKHDQSNVPTGKVTLASNLILTGGQTLTITSGTLDQGASFNLQTSNVMTVNANGTFNGGSGNADINVQLSLSGGTFRASSTSFIEKLQRTAGTFDPNNGTVVLDGSVSVDHSLNGVTFNNLTCAKTGGATSFLNGTPTVLAVLTLHDGFVNSGTIDAQGGVTVGPSFDGGNATLSISGPAPTTITFAAGMNLLNVTLNAPNTLIETSGGGTLNWQDLSLQAGLIEQDADFVVNGIYNQSGGTFTCTNNVSTFNGGITQSGGMFNGGSGDVRINGGFGLLGGTFKASSGNTYLRAGFSIPSQVSGGTFDSNNGTFIFEGSSAAEISLFQHTVTFNKLTFNKNNNVAVGYTSGTIVVTGTLTFADGIVNSSTITAQGNVSIAGPFDGGSTGLSFTGVANQTYNNTGGANLNDIGWTIDKTSGTVTAASSILLGTSQLLNIKNGTLYLNNNSNLTCGALTLGDSGNPAKAGRLVNESATAITLGGNVQVLNNSSVYLQGGGSACPQADSILLRSSTSGTRRDWSGSGDFRMVDVDVQDMGGIDASTPAITVFNGTNSGNNNSNWTFNNSCSTGIGHHLGFLVQPSSTVFGQTITPPVQVGIKDQFDNLVDTASDAITLAINPDVPLSGTLTRNAVNGVAVFDNLSINNLGTGYTLIASASALASAISDPFNIFDPFGVINSNNSGDGSLRQAIINANNTPGTQTITFNLAVNGEIRPYPELPPITDPVIIDGTTQPGYAGTPLIYLYGGYQCDIGGDCSNCSECVGLTIEAGNSTVKGLVIYNWSAGIILQGNGNNTILANSIGQGGTFEGNFAGIILSSNNNRIGGPSAIERNVICNNSAGIVTGDSSGNVIQGNYIGIRATGTPSGNDVGLQITSGTSNLSIGGRQPGEGNIIANNFVGVDLQGYWAPRPQGVSIFGNSIYSNGRGIEISPEGVSSNDSCDQDSGANNNQNFPVLTSASSSGGGNTTITGTLNSTPNRTFTIDFYSNAVCDTNGYGQGKTYLASTTVITGASCNSGTFTAILPVQLTTELMITATTTDAAGNTSEFSACKGVVTASISGTVRDNDGFSLPNTTVVLKTSPGGSKLRTAITDRAGRFSFDALNPTANYVVEPSKNNYHFTPANRTYNNLVSAVDDTYLGEINTYTISGQATLNGFALGNTLVTAVGPGGNYTVNSNSSGNYSMPNLPVGNYTVTPTKQYHSFNPPSVNVTLSRNLTVNFTAVSTPLSALRGRILFNNGSAIRGLNADGTGLITLHSVSPDSAEWPSLSHDGKQIAFVRRRPSSVSLQTMNADGSNVVTVLDDNDKSAFPGGARWSWDGTKLAFYKSSSLFTINIDGSNLTSITSTAQCSHPPDWAPDGSKLVFASFNSTTHLYKIQTVTNNASHVVTPLMSGTPYLAAPKWSPDGSIISFQGVSHNILLMNANGSNVRSVASSGDPGVPFWSPDSLRIAAVRDFQQEIFSILLDGTDELIMFEFPYIKSFDWGNDNTLPTHSGSNVDVESGRVLVTFPSINGNGFTTITPISPLSAGTTPGGFRLDGLAYEISTTANYTPPIAVCFTVPTGAYTTQQQFDGLSILHNEGGTLVDRTVSRDFSTRTICAAVNSFSPLVLAEQIDQTLPSITGLVIDQDGNPLTDIQIRLSGDEERFTATDNDGFFSFANLVQGGNYSVTPNQLGYLFDFPYQSYIGINGDNTVVFTGTAPTFTISGRVRDGNGILVSDVQINLAGDLAKVATTDVNGYYTFTDLPANGLFSLSAFKDEFGFTPVQQILDPLTSDQTEVNFTLGPVCAFGASSSSQFFSMNGGSGSVNVTTGSACSWTAAPSDSWITIVSADNGTGNGVVDFEVRENFTSSARQATINISGQLLTIVQDGGLGDDCGYSISSFSQSFSAAGGAGLINISAEDRCAWQAVPSAPWITITSAGVGIGNGSVSYNVAPNPGPGGRAATITIGGKVFAVKQKGP